MSCLATAPAPRVPLPPVAMVDHAAAVEAAWERLSGLPRYRQIIEWPAAGARIETMVAGDRLYHRLASGDWRPLFAKAGGRRAAFDWTETEAPVTSAVRLDDGTVAGAATAVYVCRTASGDTHRVWVGLADGLIHRYAADDVTITIIHDRPAARG